ncbi:ras-related protein rapA isoform X1 [Macrobrachium rosenbergii]|uniref:ras-related protein rapA isoform X1 n=1 Tax=Macrobrachium rosenbergii TaxID=79674 RepID=UPI0034D77201
MELCGGCFVRLEDSQPYYYRSKMMKARHFARRFSLQPALYEEERPTSVSKDADRSTVLEDTDWDTPTPVTKEDEASGPSASAGTSSGAMDKGSNESKKKRYRIVVMGAAKVGKTAIINQFLYDQFTPKYTRTVEEMHHGEYEVSGMSLTLDILDTSGSYEFPAMRELSINTADAFILVYAINDADSFEEVRNLREIIMNTKKKTVPIVVVGNKRDMEDQRAVPTEAAETIVLLNWENGFLEASAKDNLNVLHIFKELLNQAKIRYALSPAVKRRRQSMPNVGMQITPSQLSHLQHIKQKHSGKRNSCVIS